MGLLSALGLKSSKAKKANQRVLALQEQGLRQQLDFFAAIADPSSEQFQKLFKFFEQGSLRDFEEGLRQALTQSNRNVARGGVGLFVNPERRDEMFGQLLARERETAGTRARGSVFDILLGAAGQPSAGIGETIGRQAELGGQQLKRATGFAQTALGFLGNKIPTKFPSVG